MSKLTDNRKWKTAAAAVDMAAETVSGVLRGAARVLVTVVLVLITTILLTMCIFAYYVKTCLSTDLNISLSDYTLSLSSTIYTTAYN